MNKRPWLKKMLSVTVLGGLLLGSVGIAYAADSDAMANTANKVKAKFRAMKPGECRQGPAMKGQGFAPEMNLDLDALVQDGLITDEEAAAIQTKIAALKTQRQTEMNKFKEMTTEERQAYFTAQKEQNEEKDAIKTDFLTTLVNENIISSDKAEAIRAAQQTQWQAAWQGNLNKDLTALVDKGTITSAQNDAIVAAMQAQQQQFQAEMEKVRAMTAEERESYLKENRPACNNCLADLVTAGTITQEQADAVCELIGAPHGQVAGKVPGANWGDNFDRAGEKSKATFGRGGCGDGQGHGGMGHFKGQGMGVR